MPSGLDRRVRALEGESRVYWSVAEMPDDVLLAMLSPLCDGRIPTNEELEKIASSQFLAGRGIDAKS